MAYGNSYPQGGYRTQMPQYAPIPLIRPVTSLEEVKASPIEFDGSIFFFTDMANKRIYTKQIGMDGAAIVNLYEQKDMTPDVKQEYVTKGEFETVINALVQKYLNPKEEETKKPLFEI